MTAFRVVGEKDEMPEKPRPLANFPCTVFARQFKFVVDFIILCYSTRREEGESRR